MKKHWIPLSLAALLTLGVAHARTNPDFARGGRLRELLAGHSQKLSSLRSKLNLTDAQRDQLKQLLLSHRDEIATALKPVIEKRRALRDKMSASTLDESAIRAASADLGQSLGDAAILVARLKAEAKPLLTADQASTLTEMRSTADDAIDTLIDNLAHP